MKSYEQLKNIQEQLTSLSDSLGNMYGAMKNECMKEIVDDKQKYVTPFVMLIMQNIMMDSNHHSRYADGMGLLIS